MAQRKIIIVPTPSKAEMQSYLDKWELLNNYVKQEKALSKLFHQTYPTNSNSDEVLVKACTLNAFYSTNIRNIFIVAEHIVNLNIDARLQAGDLSLVNDLTTVPNFPARVYSFATKYCSHHKPNNFPIYDSYVEKVLLHFQKLDRFGDFGKECLRNYAKFFNAVISFQKFYNLQEFSVKEIDRYLWLLGKHHFPKTFWKKKNNA